MDKSINKRAGGLIALIASAFGVAHAENFKFEWPPLGQEQNEIVNELQQSGFIAPVPGYTSWYQINRARLDETITQNNFGDPAAMETIVKLKRIVGDGVDIKQVDIFKARVGTQDY